MSGRLKIALILETSGGGSGRHVLDLAAGLAGRGHAVTVIWAPDRAQDDFVTQLQALEGVRALALPMRRAVGLHDLRARKALAALLRAEGPFDILHGHSSKAGALLRLLGGGIPGARIYTPHAFRTMDPGLSGAPRMIYGLIERLLAPRADRIIAVSGAEKAHAESLGIAPARVAVVVNGVRLPDHADRAGARAAMGLNDDQIAVGFIGRLEPQKDPLRFVSAMARAVTDAPALRGVVIGDGPLRAGAEAAAPAGALRFLGWQDGPALIPGLDIFCMTSRYEAMPYTLLEALHAGVPIVTTDVGGAAETVVEGQNGHILPLDSDSAAIGAALAGLAADNARRAGFGQASRQMAQRRSIDAMVDGTLAVYEAAL